MVVDSGFSSTENLRYMQRAGGHYIAGMKLRSGTAEARLALGRQGRYHLVAENMSVKQVIVGDGAARQRFVVARNPWEAERDRERREQTITRLEGELAKLEQVRGAAHEKAACKLRAHRSMGRYIRQTKTGRLMIDRDKIRQEARLDGKYLISTSDDTLSPEDVALGYKNLLEAERGFRDLKGTIPPAPCLPPQGRPHPLPRADLLPGLGRHPRRRATRPEHLADHRRSARPDQARALPLTRRRVHPTHRALSRAAPAPKDPRRARTPTVRADHAGRRAPPSRVGTRRTSAQTPRIPMPARDPRPLTCLPTSELGHRRRPPWAPRDREATRPRHRLWTPTTSGNPPMLLPTAPPFACSAHQPGRRPLSKHRRSQAPPQSAKVELPQTAPICETLHWARRSMPLATGSAQKTATAPQIPSVRYGDTGASAVATA